MNDLNDLLETVARPSSAPGPDATADLARARTALKDRRRRAYRVSLGAFTAVAVMGVGTAAVVGGQGADPTTAPSPSVTPSGPSSSTPPEKAARPSRTSSATPVVVEEVSLVAQQMQAGPYTFGTTPQGWELQNNESFAVTIGRIGDPDTDPASFVGKLVIMLDDNPLGSGEHVTRDGRDLVVRDNGDGYTTVSAVTRAGEPDGTVRIQFPDGIGWTRDAALTFLSSVEVGPGAEVVHG